VHLELWLGARGHGWDGSIDDLFPILDAVRFPRLKYLGLRNSEIADDIARAVVQSPLIEKLNTLDLSLGNLSDAGGRSLWGLMWDLPLKQLNLSHHYLSLEMVRTLQNELRCKVVADQPKVECAGRRPVFVSE
jgi:hypothetical protein